MKELLIFFAVMDYILLFAVGFAWSDYLELKADMEMIKLQKECGMW